MSEYQLQLHQIDEDGNIMYIMPINTGKDVIVNEIEISDDLVLPGLSKGETLETAMSHIKRYLENLANVALVKRNISSSTELDDANTLASSSAIYNLQKQIKSNLTEINAIKKDYAIKNHASTKTDYGIGTDTLYGHVKLSDVYDTSDSFKKAANAIGASQYALYSAYSALKKGAEDISSALTNHIAERAKENAYGHVQIGDNITVNNGVISVSAENVKKALGYTPLKEADLKPGTGISISGTTITNSGVRTIVESTKNGYLSVNTNGTTADIFIHGLKSAAYTDSSDYAKAVHDHTGITNVNSNNKGTNTTPNDYNSYLKIGGLKQNSAIGNPDSSTYSGLIGYRAYTSSVGGLAQEFAFTGSGRLYRRTGETTTWGNWKEMLDNDTLSKYLSFATGATNGYLAVTLNGTKTDVLTYKHPTTSGNKHIPSGGSSDQILSWSADGTAVWGTKKTFYNQETQFSSGTYTDPLPNTACAVKVSGNLAATKIYENGKTLSDIYSLTTHDHSGLYYSAKLSHTANTVLAAPNGSDGTATFRKLVAADIPSLTVSKISDFPTLGNVSSKAVRTLSAVGPSGWVNKETDQKYIPDMALIAYWNGAYTGTSSNLAYCNRGAFGTIVTKNSGDYVTMTGTETVTGTKTFSKPVVVSDTTASTSKTTGALKVSGGAGISGRMSAGEVMIGNGCTLTFDSTNKCVNFVFA